MIVMAATWPPTGHIAIDAQLHPLLIYLFSWLDASYTMAITGASNAQLASATNINQVQQIINGGDVGAVPWSNGDLFGDDDWEEIAALAAESKLNGTANMTDTVLAFINATLPNKAKAQQLYTNLTLALKKQNWSANR